MKKRAIALLSGGQDSTTCLFWAKERFGQIIALNVDYGQRHLIEIEAASKIASMAGVEYIMHHTDIFSKIGDSALLNQEWLFPGSISSSHRGDPKVPASFVPGRNILLLTIAAAIAYKHDILHIITGVCETDSSGYADCRQGTITSIQATLQLGMEKPFRIHTPLMELNKVATVQLARDLPGCWDALSYSHTCYEGAVPPCEVCPSCILRAKGFAEAGEIDPLFERLKRLSND